MKAAPLILMSRFAQRIVCGKRLCLPPRPSKGYKPPAPELEISIMILRLSPDASRMSRSLLSLGFIVAAGLTLSACVGMNRFGGGATQPSASVPNAAGDIASQDLPPLDGAPQGDALAGQPAPNGKFRVGLILPLTAPGATGQAGQSLKNAADMAMEEFQGANIELVVKDDHGTADGGREAAKQALAEGANAIIGPLLGPSVQAAGAVARAANKPIIAFSTDSGVAGRGVYLLSFMPQSDVDRILDYAASNNKGNLAALIPETTYGSVVNALLQDGAAKRGIKILAIERYSVGTAEEAAKRIATLSGKMDSLFIAENGDGAENTAKALQRAGIDKTKVQLLGTSSWDDPRIYAQPIFQGGWFPLADKTGYQAFAQRYRTKYGSDPIRLATLAYDAVFLANALHGKYGDQAFTEANLTSSDGAIGIDGLFRFKPDGTSSRALLVMQANKSGPTQLDGAR
jgi:ABC-type branched-subunit amino acid transport system substrate-binding protein